MQTFQFEIRQTFAQSKEIPMIFVGKILKETPKAVYIYGHGSSRNPENRALLYVRAEINTPGIRGILGIGPECGKHFLELGCRGGYTPENVERLKGKLQDIIVDTWMPKSIVLSQFNVDETVTVPTGHPMTETAAKPAEIAKLASLTSYKSSGEPAIKIEFPFDYKTLEQLRAIIQPAIH